MADTNILDKKKKLLKVLKYVKRFFIYTLSSFLFLICLAILLAYIYEDEIKKFAVEQMNKQLNSEIQVREIELSLIKKFPYASLTFTDIIAKDAITTNPKGNLMKAEKVYLEFSIVDIFNKNYKIKKIEIKNATIIIIEFADGTDNYYFWKKTTSGGEGSNFLLDLQKIILNNVHIKYKNFSFNQHYSFIAEDVILKGKFSNDDYTLYSNGDIYINFIKSQDISFFNNKDANIKMVLNVVGDTYSFKKGALKVGDLLFDVSGKIIYNNRIHQSDLQIKGNEMRIKSFIKELPIQFKKYLDKYQCTGDFYFDCIVKGSFKGEDWPLVNAHFGVTNAEFIESTNNIALKNLSFTGNYINGQEKRLSSNVIMLQNFSAVLETGTVKGEIRIKNLTHPEIEIVTDAKLNLKALNDFIKMDNVSSIDGTLILSASFKGKINDKTFTFQDFFNSTCSGKMSISKMNLKLKDNTHNFSDINGHFQFNNNDVIIDDLTGNVSKSDFSVNGYFRNALSFFFLPNQRLLIDADIKSKKIDINDLLTQQTTSTATTYKLCFSDKYDFKINFDIDKLNFNKFNASNASGKIKLKKKQLFINPISFDAMDGTIRSLVMIDGVKPDQLLISTETSVKNIDITKLFYEFGNFGQDNLKDENIKGILTADVQFASVWSSSLEIDYNKIYTQANISIEKGELLNYAPMKGLSKFLKVEDLSDVKFATLKNQIEIKNQTIYFPMMDIKSSAINIQASGTHTFKNEINYKLRILLSDILAKKAKKAKKENEEFGVEEDDGVGKTTLYITVFGTVDKPEYKYDTKGVKEKIIVGFIKEKQNLKNILKDEFGWIKKDSTKTKEEKKEKKKEKTKDNNNSNFTIEWDEDNEK